jgi:hypothetical protein
LVAGLCVWADYAYSTAVESFFVLYGIFGMRRRKDGGGGLEVCKVLGMYLTVAVYGAVLVLLVVGSSLLLSL